MELYKKPSKVIKLSPSSFVDHSLIPSFVKNKDLSLIMYYASWCGFCQRSEPIWIKFATSANKNVAVAVVDAVKYPELSSNFGVNSYPTIKVFNKQGIYIGDYAGERDIKSLKEFSSSLLPEEPKKSKKKKVITKETPKKTSKKVTPKKTLKKEQIKKSVSKKILGKK